MKPERSNLSGFCMFVADIHEKRIEWCEWRGGYSFGTSLFQHLATSDTLFRAALTQLYVA